MARDTLETTPAERTLLAYVNDQEQGLRRVAHAKGFSYVDADGRTVKDEATLARIKALVIPPAWTSVWICPDPNGHIQAIGRDQKNRKQYRYHPEWRADRDARKYGRMAAFGRALPRLRAQVEHDLGLRGPVKDKVLATAVRLLEITLIRVGNEEYAQANKSFGLTTLRDRHARLSSVGGTFQFKGKSGVVHTTGFRDRRLARIVKACQDIPGQRLFQYLDEDGQRRTVESADVNAYIRAAMGQDFSAKDFRTWAGSLAALEALSLSPKPETKTEAKRTLNTCVKAVAGLLGNTPAVCRAAYIHPKVLEAFEASQLPKRRPSSPRARELALLRLVAA